MLKHIVIIEHDPGILAAMKYFLEEEGHVVTAFEVFPSLKDLVIMHADCFIIEEWHPEVSGHAISLMLKAKLQTNPIPVILTTTARFPETYSDVCEADALLKKPVDRAGLVCLVNTMLSKRRAPLSRYGQL